MAEELLVVLNKNDPTCGLGFSLLGAPGLPPIIYDIVEHSPAAESGKVEAGDVILKVNETEVNRLNTKEVLRCLRLCGNPVSLILKRDPSVKARVRRYLSTPDQYRGEMSLSDLIEDSAFAAPPAPTGELRSPSELPPPFVHPPPLESVTRTNGEPASGGETPNGAQQPKFEAFVMTGDRVLKICRTQQGSVLPKQRKVDSLRNIMHPYNNHQRNASVPTSPVEAERLPASYHHRPIAGSASTSPTPTSTASAGGGTTVTGGGASYVVRTSKSEDHLQSNKESMSTVSIDIDDDVTASLNTLLDTRQDSECEDQRIVWTYNAPRSGSSSSRTTSSDNVSPARPDSPASPTSVSSSVMSSSSSTSSSTSCGELGAERRRLATMAEEKLLSPLPTTAPVVGGGGDLSQSEAVSNISSPDFQEEDSEIIARDLVMEVSDPSDSDSTLLVSDHSKRQHRIIIQVEGPDRIRCDNSKKEWYSTKIQGEQTYRDDRSSENESEYNSDYELADEESLVKLTEGAANLAKSVSPPPLPHQQFSSEDDSDVESLHSYHYSPKGVDMPSAVRLAKRLYMLDGFKKSDVSRHLSKNNEFSRAVAEEYLKYFSFNNNSLDAALRKFLSQFCLTGETQERERVLVHFSKRYLDCNSGVFTSQDAVHTLTCAIMLLNTDMHSQTIGRKMTCNEFIDNLAELNDGDNFPREVLKTLYQSIKSNPLEWAVDEETEETNAKSGVDRESPTIVQTGRVLFDVPSSAPAVEYKKGYVMRKCCVEPNGKKTPLGKRGWKMYYCTLRDLVLYLHKDEHGFRRTQLSDNLHNAIRIHHSLATKANDYTKKLHVFRLETADQAVYLFQTSDSKELTSWVEIINYIAANLSAPPLPGAVGSQKKFQRPLLPSSITRLNPREQLRDHENMVQWLESELEIHRKHPPERGAKQLAVYNFREKDNYLQFELKRYKLYLYHLRSRLSQLPDMIEGSLIESIGESSEEGGGWGGVEERRSGSGSPGATSSNRYSYRAAIYARDSAPADIG